MSCYHPLVAWQSKKCKSNGKKFIVFSDPANNKNYDMINLPCGQCIGCRLDYSRMWAVRCVHESQMHSQNCFITLTYDDNHVPWNKESGEQTLVKKDLQDFFKRLRKRIYPAKVRFYACGEYGDTTHRPHYHAILFGYDFPDKVKHSLSGTNMLYTSNLLFDLWPFGHSAIADVTFDSCAYVARYVMKKVKGKHAKDYYDGFEKEFVNMSRKPGIAREWFEKYGSDVYPLDDCIVSSGDKIKHCKPPRYYDVLFDLNNPDEFQKVKARRLERAKDKEIEIYNGRLEAKEKVKKAKIKKLERKL